MSGAAGEREMEVDVDDDAVPAGPFSSWLREALEGLATGRGIDVPCGSCTACCRSAYFIHVEPDEVDALRHIPAALRFPAPGLPKGHVVLGYDEQGRCPMLVDEGCSIYAHRPRTCRTYDCRVFPAAGVSAADDGKPLVDERARRWRFDHPTPADVAEHDAVRATAVALRGSDEARTSLELAVLAVRRSGSRG